MSERPILFSAAMVLAILGDRKTQTRRIIKPQPVSPFRSASGAWVDMDAKAGEIRALRCPYGEPGDRLWVRETFQPLLAQAFDWSEADWDTGHGYEPRYVATDGRTSWRDPDDKVTERCMPGIHMPRWASRILLEVTGVRVEPVQNISTADAIAEGIERPQGRDEISARDAYRELWLSINGPGMWEANPLVWVVEFKRLP